MDIGLVMIESMSEEKDLGCWWMKNWTCPSHVNVLTRKHPCPGLIPTAWAKCEGGFCLSALPGETGVVLSIGDKKIRMIWIYLSRCKDSHGS